MKPILLNIIALIIIFSGGFVSGYLWDDLAGCNSSDKELIVLDSNTQERAELELAEGTKIRLIEKPFKKHVPPVYTKKEKVDPPFLKKIAKKDLMISVAKKGDKLRVFAVNPEDSTVTERLFEGITENFTATSDEGSVYVKTQRFILEPWRFTVSHSRYFNEYEKLNQGSVKIGWQPKLKISTWLELDAGITHDFGAGTTGGFETLIQLTIKP